MSLGGALQGAGGLTSLQDFRRYLEPVGKTA